MALYEGIALIQEKQAVVLDLGSEYTKFGFSGEPSPRCVVRSECWCPRERRLKRVFDYSTPEELYENLVNLLHTLYFKHVLVNPKERKVVVVESLLAPTRLRETLAQALFLHLEVSSALWVDGALCCALALAAPAALVVQLGAADSEVVAVAEGRALLSTLQWAGPSPGGAEAEAEAWWAGLARCVLRCLAAAPVDLRRPLLRALLVSGGRALPGDASAAELARRLRSALEQDARWSCLAGEVRVLRSPTPASVLAWAGGSLVGGAGGGAGCALPRSVFQRRRRVPDWPDLLERPSLPR